MKIDVYPSTPKPQFLNVRHSRMLLAGIPGKSELDPRLKHSVVTPLESHLSTPQLPIFKGGDEEHEVRDKYLTFVAFVCFVVRSCLRPLAFSASSASAVKPPA